MFENYTNTLIFKPASKWVSGRQYYFTIVVKEKHSDSIKYSFYCTVRVTGEVYDYNDYEYYYDYDYYYDSDYYYDDDEYYYDKDYIDADYDPSDTWIVFGFHYLARRTVVV